MATITLKGAPVHTSGHLPSIGSHAPHFKVTKTDLTELNLEDCLGKTVVLNIFPSLDTPVCSTAMHRFNDIAAQHPGLSVLCLSADLPFAQKRFCAVDHLANVLPASTFRHPTFGKDYGVEITDGPLKGLLSRAIVILDATGTVIYTQQVKEITDEPDYDAMIAALKK
jgi:thioredoxin-dependent peroxiredoxin